MKYLVLTVAILALILMLLSVFFVSKLMGLEMIFIFQIGYIGLMMVTKLEASMAALKGLNISVGYNGLLADSSTSSIPIRLQ